MSVTVFPHHLLCANWHEAWWGLFLPPRFCPSLHEKSHGCNFAEHNSETWRQKQSPANIHSTALIEATARHNDGDKGMGKVLAHFFDSLSATLSVATYPRTIAVIGEVIFDISGAITPSRSQCDATYFS